MLANNEVLNITSRTNMLVASATYCSCGCQNDAKDHSYDRHKRSQDRRTLIKVLCPTFNINNYGLIFNFRAFYEKGISDA